MLFNSIEFAIFLPIVFALYWSLQKSNVRYQNILLIVAGFIFYGWWDWRFLSLLTFSALADYLVGLGFARYGNTKTRKILILTSIGVQLGLLGVFKYYNFFVENFVSAFSMLGHRFDVKTLNIILPVGISFYTFQTLTYTIGVYKRQLEPTKDIIAFTAYVSFFPQLLAGPIERAVHLLPKYYTHRTFEYSKAVDGLRQILWGLFKKIVIADNCAKYANMIFNNANEYHGSTLLVGAFFFTFQIYCDFSGYSDIAIGVSRLFGIDLMRNFAYPYFSRDMAEFWRRWHISLTTWFRDYVYIPLGGNQGSIWRKIRNIFIVFVVSGFWHGANWTFIAWGLINAVCFLPLMLLKRNRKNTGILAEGKLLPSAMEFFQIAITFLITLLAWIFFRAENIKHASLILSRIFSASIMISPQVLPKKLLLIILIFVLVEWLQRDKLHPMQLEHWRLPQFARWLVYYILLYVILIFGGTQQQFIYFQF